MRALVRSSRALAAVLLVALAIDCAPPPGLGLQAPGLVRQALDVVDDLGAAATLVPRGGTPLPALQLVRGEDGVTFTGFLDAAPGEYTLEVVFSGVVTGDDEGARVFLGRLGSDPFTVTQGQAASPTFSQPLDTIGRDGDGGDEDGDGLGLLLELLLGTSPLARDSDNDGVEDGDDCSPDDVTNVTVIVDGGSLADCDADGFETALPLLGEPGDDCDDGNASIHPGADDDCGTLEDSDCNPATCPINDAEGPVVVLVTPGEGVAAGCQAELVIAASDPSEVLGVSATLPDRPIAGGYVRTLSFADNGDGTWSSTGLNATGPGLVDGNERLLILASDGRGNSSSTETTLQVALGFPAVSWDAPPSLGTEVVTINLTPQGPRPLTVLEIRSAPLDANGLINPTTVSTVATLPVDGGSAIVDPASLSGSVAIFPYAVDDVGNALLPYAQSMPMSGSTTADYRCDGATHSIPASVRVAGRGRVTALHYLQDALDLMTDLDPTQSLVKIILFGLQSDGTIDLSSSDFIFLAYYFNDAGGGNGKSVIYFSSAPSYGSRPFPEVNEDDGSLSGGNPMDPTGLIDSDVAVAAWPCGGNGPSGQGTDDMIMYIRNDGNAFDSIYLSTSDGWTWGVHADNLGTPTFGCSAP